MNTVRPSSCPVHLALSSFDDPTVMGTLATCATHNMSLDQSYALIRIAPVLTVVVHRGVYSVLEQQWQEYSDGNGVFVNH